MTLVDPCLTTELNIIEPDPFENLTYTLRDPQINQFWDIDNLITKDTKIDCGPLTVSFFNVDKGKSALDSSLFLDDRRVPGAFNLAILNTDDA